MASQNINEKYFEDLLIQEFEMQVSLQDPQPLSFEVPLFQIYCDGDQDMEIEGATAPSFDLYMEEQH